MTNQSYGNYNNWIAKKLKHWRTSKWRFSYHLRLKILESIFVTILTIFLSRTEKFWKSFGKNFFWQHFCIRNWTYNNVSQYITLKITGFKVDTSNEILSFFQFLFCLQNSKKNFDAIILHINLLGNIRRSIKLPKKLLEGIRSNCWKKFIFVANVG